MTHLGVWTLSFQPAKVAPPSKVISSDNAPSAKMDGVGTRAKVYIKIEIIDLISIYGL
tara:strand:- start:306 stop:479 length:174 start_codon:yes stop_codon:yes gene_type:complete